ncbi:MAG: hypothetical protein IPF93_08205 [Saprospiraceae bacterium]|nr:hypothetical protein [Saprospiraceae bacterium]
MDQQFQGSFYDQDDGKRETKPSQMPIDKLGVNTFAKRDLSPSIDHQKVFSKQRPGDAGDYIIEVDGSKDLKIEVFSK